MALDPSLRTPLTLGAVAAVGTLGIAAWAPTDNGPPLCASRFVIGVDCPFCGGLRCVSSLARLDFVAAADHNLLLAVALPAVALWWVWWVLRVARGGDPPRVRATPAMWWGLGIVATVFSVVRNLDLGPVTTWLAASAS